MRAVNAIRQAGSAKFPAVQRGLDRFISTLALFFLLSVSGSARAAGTTVSLGTVSGLPTAEVFIPVLLDPSPSEVKIGDITAAIKFENKLVSFVRAEKGFLLDGVSGVI